MQTQPISEATAAEGVHAAPDHALGSEQSPKKKSMMSKVKDKAKKLKTKIKKPKSPGAADHNDDSSSASSSEEESGSDPHQQVGDQAHDEREVAFTPGLQGDAFQAIPDPHVSAPSAGTAGVEQRFGHMSLGEEPDTNKLQEEVPSAPGHVSAGVTPYLASHNLGESRDIPVEDGKNAEGKDLLVTPDSQGITGMDYEKTPEVSKTSDNTAAWYTPTTEDKASEEGQQQKPLTDRAYEGVAATTAAGAGALGVKSLSDDSENVESKGADVAGGKKSMLEQAKERIFGTSTTSPKTSEGDEQQLHTGETKPTITGKAMSFKDTIAAKLGYGSNKDLTAEGDNNAAASPVDTHAPENKSVLQKIQESAAGVTGAVTSKVGNQQTESQVGAGEGVGVGENVGAGENKSYTQKAYDAAYGAKDAVASKIGYGGTASTDSATQGEQKSYFQGAKEAVTSKLGYANRELPASTEGAYADEQNVPASTADRFHPGEEDRALSQLITEKMSTGAATVKDTLMRPFSPKSGPPTPTTTPPPSSAAAVAEDPIHNTVTDTRDVAEGEQKPGIVGKVTGVVTSLLGTSGSGKKRADEATGKASEDAQAAAVETH